jgi:hypothetical protein
LFATLNALLHEPLRVQKPQPLRVQKPPQLQPLPKL